MRHGFRLVLAALWLTLPLVVGPARAEGSAAKFIRLLGDTAIRELAPDGITQQQREARFRVLLRENFDLPRISRFVLGRFARRVSDREMAEFAALYEDLIVLTHAQMFAAYAGQGFKVIKELGVPGEKYLVVASEVSNPDGSPVARLDWQVLVGGDGLAVVDIRVEGVSMAVAQRDDFTSFLERNDGDFALFLAEITRRINKLRLERGGR